MSVLFFVVLLFWLLWIELNNLIKTLYKKEYVMTIDILIKNCIMKLVLHIII